MENKFIDGFFINKPRENAPDFVKGGLSININKFIPYLHSKANAKGYVNIDLLTSKDGGLYAKLNDWKPEERFAKDEQGKISVESDGLEGLDELGEEEVKIQSIPF